MPDFYSQWSAAKADLTKYKGLFPPDMLEALSKGTAMGPALKDLDKAKSYEDRAVAVAKIREAKGKYESRIGYASKLLEGDANRALTRLGRNLNDIWKEADKLGQAPRPSGSMVDHEVLRGFNLAAGVKPKFLDIKATNISVAIEVDRALNELIEKGEESLKIAHLGDVAKAEVDKVADKFASTIKDLDKSIESMDEAKRETEIKKANETLEHYAKLVEDGVDEVVQAQWKSYLTRKDYLKSFRIKSAVKIALGAVAIGISLSSAILSFGALWINILGIIKVISDMAQTIKTWAKDLDTVYEELVSDMEHVHKLNLQRDAAKAKDEGQKASKAGEAAKEAINSVLPITKTMLKSASSIADRAKQLQGLVSKLETQSDKLMGKLNEATKLMTKLPEKQMTDALRSDAKKLDDTFTKLFDEIADLHGRSQRCASFGERALKNAETLQKEDKWSALTEKAVGTSTKGAAIYALVNFSLECAKHGATLLSVI